MMSNRHAHRSNSNIKVVSLAKNHATRKHMCEPMWVWKGLMGCWGLSSCTEVREGQQFRWRTCFTLTVGLSMDMARSVLWEGGGPCHLQLRQLHSLWLWQKPPGMHLKRQRLTWGGCTRILKTSLVLLGKSWNLTRMFSLGLTAQSWITPGKLGHFLLFCGSISGDNQPLLLSDRVDFQMTAPSPFLHGPANTWGSLQGFQDSPDCQQLALHSAVELKWNVSSSQRISRPLTDHYENRSCCLTWILSYIFPVPCACSPHKQSLPLNSWCRSDLEQWAL